MSKEKTDGVNRKILDCVLAWTKHSDNPFTIEMETLLLLSNINQAVYESLEDCAMYDLTGPDLPSHEKLAKEGGRCIMVSDIKKKLGVT